MDALAGPLAGKRSDAAERLDQTKNTGPTNQGFHPDDDCCACGEQR
jgi:hypothetical protein